MVKSKVDILVVDDKPENLKLVVQLLSKEGYQIRPAPSGELALKAMDKLVPDLVLLDVTMPGLNGYEVCERIKQNDKLKSVPVIFLSALSDTFDKVKAFKVGGVDYISKPFQAEELIERVKTHLEIKNLRHTIEEKNKSLEISMHELKHAQQSVVESEKMASLGVMTAGIAHELNNPLNFVINSSSAIKAILSTVMDNFTPDFKKKNPDFEKDINLLLDNVISGGERMGEIIKALRYYSHGGATNFEMAIIEEIINSAITILAPIGRDEISIECNYEKIPQFLCYPAKLNQVFLNLIKNAKESIIDNPQFDKTSGLIKIATKSVEYKNTKALQVTISDNGPGIDAEALTTLFDPFVTTKAVGEGVGLGLSITKGIINDHKGKISAKNVDNNGAEFTIVLPLNPQDLSSD